jgi:hypothetical protein
MANRMCPYTAPHVGTRPRVETTGCTNRPGNPGGSGNLGRFATLARPFAKSPFRCHFVQQDAKLVPRATVDARLLAQPVFSVERMARTCR